MSNIQLIVSKFGGTSMGSAEAILQSAQIVQQFGSKIMVVSATSGTTDQLVKLTDTAQKDEWSECKKILQSLKEKHIKLASALSADDHTYTAIERVMNDLESLARGVNLLRECSARAGDSILACGERLSSPLAAWALSQITGSDHVCRIDARSLLITDAKFGHAKPLIDQIKNACLKNLGDKNKLLQQKKTYVTEGYIAQTLDGLTTTLGRGGSDYSGALLAEGVGADLLQIWTDVPGIASTDPRLVKEARSIAEITFDEASEMAIFGAKVLHPTTLVPARRGKIAVFVGSTFEPKKAGTWIKETTTDRPLVRALALRKGQMLITLTNPEMLEAHGFLARYFELFARHNVSVDSISTSEISVAVTLDSKVLQKEAFLSDLQSLGTISVEADMALVSLIGNKINHTPGLAALIFNELKDINVRLICQGASVHNVCFLIAESESKEAITRLHCRFIEV